MDVQILIVCKNMIFLNLFLHCSFNISIKSIFILQNLCHELIIVCLSFAQNAKIPHYILLTINPVLKITRKKGLILLLQISKLRVGFASTTDFEYHSLFSFNLDEIQFQKYSLNNLISRSRLNDDTFLSSKIAVFNIFAY